MLQILINYQSHFQHLVNNGIKNQVTQKLQIQRTKMIAHLQLFIILC